MANEPVGEGGNGEGPTPQRLAIRRLRDEVRETLIALDELEARIDLAPPEHVDGLLRSAARFSGYLGVLGHDTRRELLALAGLYPY